MSPSRIGLAIIVGAGAIAASGVASITATQPSSPVPLTRAAFSPVVTTGLSLNEPLTVNFSTPMDEDSVAASLRVQPAQDVDLAWDAGHQTLTIRPAGAWRPDTLHSVTVDPGALALTGRPMARPVRAAFLTRTATDGRIDATRPQGKRIAIDSGFTITFSRPVTEASVVAGLRADPVMDGTLVPATWNRDGTTAFTFTPRRRLPVNTNFTLSLSGVRTDDGEVLAPVAYKVHTVSAPKVARVRPAAKSTGVERTAKISVRFSQPMDKTATKKAFSVKVNGKTIKGKVSFSKRRQGPDLQAEEGAAVRGQGDGDDRRERYQQHRHADQQEDHCEVQGRTEAAVRGLTVVRRRLDQYQQRRLRRRRQLGGGRALLPGAHELHAHRRLGDVIRLVLEPGWTQRRAAQARLRDLEPGVSTVCAAPRHQRAVQPLRERRPGRPAAPRGLHGIQLGREHRLPGWKPVRSGPRHASLLPERAGVPTAATTAT